MTAGPLPEGTEADQAAVDDLSTGAAESHDSAAPAAGGGRRGHHSYAEGGPGASSEPGAEDEFDHTSSTPAESPSAPPAPAPASEGDALAEEDTMAATLLVDLQRLQAEYVNYKRRVDRDREVIRATAISGVVESLLPVLDDIHMARQAGDLTGGPFSSIADKLESVLGRHGVERVGHAGEEFDPNVHEALMHVEAELPQGATETTVVQVLQPGYRIGERLVRAARVSVADPA